HPDDRYATAADLRADLEEVEARHRPTLEIGTPPPGTREQIAIKLPARKRFPWAIVILAAGVVVLAVLFAKLMR
ncbi:MAG TPA: hypothetical protein VNX15_10520, partial [Gemmatimonadales bacterium]|nr:hypothetical protein [Gemmatimonadales bacterium]